MIVKICGITHIEDAENAASFGADYIGMIFCEQSRRHVSIAMAKRIAQTIREGGAKPVGVFVQQTADQISHICQEVGINTIQLHGKIAKESLAIFIEDYTIFYTIPVEKNGSFSKLEALPSSLTCLYDHSSGGTGASFDWSSFSPPQDESWMLAGGLNPKNVAEAINLLKPSGVDVATGVEMKGSTKKDPLLMKAFIQAAKKENL